MGLTGDKLSIWWREIVSRFSARRDDGPIATVDRLYDFAATRAAFVAQKKLYGYLKTRMGTQWVKMFEDDLFIESVNIAKMHVFAACLSDLTVFCVAKATSGAPIDAGARDAMAVECFKRGIEANAAQAPDRSAIDDWHAAFEQRLGAVHWENAAATGEVFEESPKALVRWAPIAPELKKFDAEIVRNSVRFAWNEVRMDFRARLDAPAVSADWNASADAVPS